MIDIPTLILWNGVALALIGALFLTYWGWQARNHELLWWCLPFVFGLVASFGASARDLMPSFWGRQAEVVCIMLAYGAVWQAARVFHHRRGVLPTVLAVVAGWLAIAASARAAGLSPAFDTMLRGLVMAAFNALAAYEFWRGRTGEPLPSRTAVVVILGANALFQGLSHLMAPLLPAPLGLCPTAPWAVVTYNLAALFVALSVTLLVVALSRERVAEEYHQLAIHDPLTGLLNRLTFDRRMEAQGLRPAAPYALLVIDIDHFKKINDGFGHHVGDAVLVEVAHTMEAVLRGSDRLYRFGGEEFVCMLPQTSVDQARRIAERIRLAVAEAIIVTPEGEVRATISIGAAASTDGTRPRDAVLADADAALYLAKHGGRNRVEVATFDAVPG